MSTMSVRHSVSSLVLPESLDIFQEPGYNDQNLIKNSTTISGPSEPLLFSFSFLHSLTCKHSNSNDVLKNLSPKLNVKNEPRQSIHRVYPDKLMIFQTVTK